MYGAVNAKQPQVRESGPVTVKLIKLVAKALNFTASIVKAIIDGHTLIHVHTDKHTLILRSHMITYAPPLRWLIIYGP